jgi:hypothetical protein
MRAVQSIEFLGPAQFTGHHDVADLLFNGHGSIVGPATLLLPFFGLFCQNGKNIFKETGAIILGSQLIDR